MKNIITTILFSVVCASTLTAQENLFRKAIVSVSSTAAECSASSIIDGDCSRKSTWMSAEGSRAPHFVEFTLPSYCKLDSIVIHTGIDISERTLSENSRAAGFWNMKNFLLQYWDDANWSDIPGTNVTENRLDRRAFVFSSPIVSFRFRIWCTDGEPIRLREVEGFGVEEKSLRVPESPICATSEESVLRSGPLKIKVFPRESGRTMKYVGYNFAHFIPGGNQSIWWEYSSVNLARVWASLEKYVPVKCLHDFGPVNSLEDFERVKAEFLSGDYIPFKVLSNLASKVQNYNHISLEKALLTLKDLGIEVLIQSSIPRSYYNTDWQTKWELWQRFFCQVYYCASVAGVQMFALQNEPNHRNHGPMPTDSWIQMSKIASDAMDCAIEKVNSQTNASLQGRYVGPVTAGTNFDWWTALAKSQRTDYRGNRTEEDVVDIFSTHSYNSPAIGYKGRVGAIDEVLKKNHPEGKTMPVIFTEIGRWMGAYYIDKAEDNNSASIFSEWAGIYTQNTLAGSYGMCAFKFGSTGPSKEPASKQGYHYIWNGNRWSEDAFVNLAKGTRAVSSSSMDTSANIIDGDKTSAWICNDAGPKWVGVDFGKMVEIGGMMAYTGSAVNPNTAPDRIMNFHAEYRQGDIWKEIPNTRLHKYIYSQAFFTVEPAICTDAIRIVIDDDGPAKVRELKVFSPHSLSRAEKSYDIAAILKNAHVVRLFAKGFKDGRPLLEIERQEDDSETDMLASQDTENGKKYLWLVSRNNECRDMRIDVSSIGCGKNTMAMIETVSSCNVGEARYEKLSAHGILTLSLPPMSVTLITLDELQRGISIVRPCSFASVNMEDSRANGRGTVEMNQSSTARNSVSYITFKLDQNLIRNASGIVLSVPGSANTDDEFRFNVYGFDGFVGKKTTWSEAPHLYPNESRSKDFSKDFFVAGEMSLCKKKQVHGIDVSLPLKRRGLSTVTFMLIRELREQGDDYDNGIRANLDLTKARLSIW